jgi:CHASE2 domain-containing sensor protein
MDPVRLRTALAAFLIALVAGLIAASPTLDVVRGLSIDFLTALRWHAFGNAHAPASSHAVVVALDEETFHTPPFEGTPSVTWTHEIGQVLSAVIDGGAKVVGFDVVFPTSIEQSAVPFGDETLGARVHGFDRDFLRALALGARGGKVVLGETQHQNQPLLPSPGQRAAVGFGRNIRPLNVYNDADDVI